MKEEMNSKVDLTKAKIVDTVMKIIARDGMKGLTTRRICTEADVAKGTLYHHFLKMEDVVAESIRFLHKQMLEQFEKAKFKTLEEFFLSLGEASISAVEEQNAATSEIGRNIAQASSGTQEVAFNIGGVLEKSESTGRSADTVLTASGELAEMSRRLQSEVSKFLQEIRS